jgi:type IV pilus assembly protein PilC
MFGIGLKQMIWLCRTMGTMLDAGLPVSRVLTVLVSQADGALRGALERVRTGVEGGETLTEAFQATGAFQPLFVQLVSAGETSGTLDRTFAELARFYEFQQRMWRYFLGQITLPVIQYVAAVAIVSFATFLTQMLAGGHGGYGGLIAGLLIGYGVPAALIVLYLVVVKQLGGTRAVHEIVLQIPVLGGVMRSLALARFSLILYLMYEGGVPVAESLRRAFEGTNNGAFAARARVAVETVEKGGTLTDALLATGLFPPEYMEVISVAEESGKISERLDWLAKEYADRAEAAMGALVSVAAKVIYACYAIIIIIFIFRIFTGYLGALQGAGRM